MQVYDFTIRRFERNDTEQVAELWRTVFSDEPPWNEPTELIRTKLTVQPELFFVCVVGTEVAGAVMAGFDGVRGWIHHLAVSPSMRRRGVARTLVSAAEAGLKEKGCRKVNLQVRATNLEVQAFYHALGYTTEERASLGKSLR